MGKPETLCSYFGCSPGNRTCANPRKDEGKMVFKARRNTFLDSAVRDCRFNYLHASCNAPIRSDLALVDSRFWKLLFRGDVTNDAYKSRRFRAGERSGPIIK